MKTLSLTLNSKTAKVELFENLAPVTCQRLLEILPQTIDIHYAKFAGQEVFGVVPMMAPIEAGKSLLEIDRGCVAFYPDRAFFCIYYGELQDEEVSITVIGQLAAEDEFIAEMEKCRYRQGDLLTIRADDDGAKPIRHRFLIDTKMGWDKMPGDLANVYAKRGIMLPGGPVVYADGETRKLADLVYTLYASTKAGEDIGDAFLGRLLDYYAFKIGGWCGLTDCADDVLQYKKLLLAPGADREAILVDFVYYINRLSMWVDLLIPWEEVTELLRK